MEYITKVSFGVTKNLGNYESLRIDLHGVVPVGKSYQEVLDNLRTKASIEADFYQSDYVDLLDKSRQIKSQLACLTSERNRIDLDFRKLKSLWSLIGIEIESKFPSEISALLSTYFDEYGLDCGSGAELAAEVVEHDPIPFSLEQDEDKHGEF